MPPCAHVKDGWLPYLTAVIDWQAVLLRDIDTLEDTTKLVVVLLFKIGKASANS